MNIEKKGGGGTPLYACKLVVRDSFPIIIIFFFINFPSSENQQKDKATIVKALFYKDLSGVHGKTQRNRMQVTLLCMEFMSARALRLLKR